MVKLEEFKGIYKNLPISTLIEATIKNGEGVLAENGALVVNTGKYTGRSPEDRFIVKEQTTEKEINWGKVNKPVSEEVFYNLYNKVIKHLKEKDVYVFDGFIGSMKEYALRTRIICEYAYECLFVNQLFVNTEKDELKKFVPEFTVIAAPDFKAQGKADGVNSEAFVIINFKEKVVLIGGTKYAGEIKKSMFTVMNFLLASKGVFPMHASVNMNDNGETALFFGLSGTGKTTLSADAERKLIGDDEHGWCEKGVFNFEGGCYAKTIKLSPDKEREIYNAIRFGSILENVVLREDKMPDYDDDSLTENTRAAYPIEYIENAELSGRGNIPKNIIFLTADAFGVMPPVSKLTKEQAMYHFMSGYTSKIAGTERGITEPTATFSTCFGEPFMPMNPKVYAELLGEKIDKYGAYVYLVNTGWVAGGYNKGGRIPLEYTRSIIKAIFDGELENSQFIEHPIFKFMMPTSCTNIPENILNPENTWESREQYINTAIKLANMFIENFKRFKDVSKDILSAEPNTR